MWYSGTQASLLSMLFLMLIYWTDVCGCKANRNSITQYNHTFLCYHFLIFQSQTKWFIPIRAKSEDAAAQIIAQPPFQRLINRDSHEFLANLLPKNSNHHQHCLQTMCTAFKERPLFRSYFLYMNLQTTWWRQYNLAETYSGKYTNIIGPPNCQNIKWP